MSTAAGHAKAALAVVGACEPQKWTLARGRPISIPLPRGVRGTLSRMTLTMKTRAPGHPVTVQRRLLRLISD
jgi:hypothetical protein